MLQNVYGLVPVGEEDSSNDPAMFVAENQTWDKATCKQLKDEYNVIFNGGIRAYMVIETETATPLIAVGHEDDGVISFQKRNGHYEDCFSAYWLDSVIDCLTRAESYCKYRSGKR